MIVACLTEFQCAVFADGELPAVESRKVMDHIETCASCRKLVDAMRAETRVLVDCFQSTDFIEFELEDETLSTPQARNLSAFRLIAFVFAMAVLLRPVLSSLEELGFPQVLSAIIMAAAYLIPVAIGFAGAISSNASWIALSAILLLGFVFFSRRSVLSRSILSVLAVLTVFSSPSYGLDIRRSDKPVTVPPGETVDDTLVVFGDSVTVDGTVTGDLIAFVREVTIRGTVKGNLVSFAQRVDLEGTIEGSAAGFAQSVQTRGQIAHNIYAFAQRAEIGPEARIDQNAIIFAGNSDIAGAVGRDVFAAATTINVAAPARIGGNVDARAGNTQSVQIAPGAMISGKTNIRTSQRAPSRYSRVSFYVWQIIWLTAAFVTGLFLFSIVPGLARVTADTTRDLLVSAGVGFLAMIATPAAALVAAITLIGLPLALITLTSWAIALYLAKIVVAGFLGRSLLTRGGDSNPPNALFLLAGLVAVFIAVNLPYVGTLINLLLVVLGLGLIVVRTYRGAALSQPQAA